jgi:hypothetical protein
MAERTFNYTPVTTATTTLVKSGAGIIGGISVNTTAAGTITVYDSLTASGTKIGTLKASVAEGTYLSNVTFSIGLTIVTAAASDVTVKWA